MKNKSAAYGNAPFTVINITLTIFFMILVQQIKQTVEQINKDLDYKNQNKGSFIALLNNQIKLKQQENQLKKNQIQIEQNEKLNSFQKLYYDEEKVSFEQSIEEKQEEINTLEKKKAIYIINSVLMVISILLCLVSLYFISKILMQIFKQNNLSSQGQNIRSSLVQQQDTASVVSDLTIQSNDFVTVPGQNQPQQSLIKKIFRWMMKRLILIVVLMIIFIAVFKL